MDLVEGLVTAVQEGEDERAAALAEEVLKKGLDLEMVVEGLTEGMREVDHAAARMGLKREQANEIVLKLLARYEDETKDAPLARNSRSATTFGKPPSPRNISTSISG